jgi:hypothetical protein
MVLSKSVMEAWRVDDPAGPEAAPGGDAEKPEDDGDIYRQLGAERAAIISDSARKLATATPAARRLIKQARAAAIAAAKRRAKAEVAGRRNRRKQRKATAAKKAIR